jgi:hypothetical protein
MLSVGRELNITERRFICHQCRWEGIGPELKTGLVRISRSDIYLYSYRCPECESYDVVWKGKLLAFATRSESTAVSRQNADEEVHPHDTVEKTNRSWK